MSVFHPSVWERRALTRRRSARGSPSVFARPAWPIVVAIAVMMVMWLLAERTRDAIAWIAREHVGCRCLSDQPVRIVLQQKAHRHRLCRCARDHAVVSLLAAITLLE